MRFQFPSSTIPTLFETPTPTFEISQILNQAMYGLFNTSLRTIPNMHNESGSKIFQQEMYHCLGDPSMMIYTDVPQSFQEPVIETTVDSIYIHVTDGDARITVNTYQNGQQVTNSYIGNYLRIPNKTEMVTITLDRHNYIPYIYEAQFIQRKNISGIKNYKKNKLIKIGNHVCSRISGDVLIQNADVSIKAESVELHPGTTIINSNVEINNNDE